MHAIWEKKQKGNESKKILRVRRFSPEQAKLNKFYYCNKTYVDEK
jgi:hypothetical protein